MKLLFDIFPVILFFIAYKTHGIYAATAIAIIATLMQIIYVKIKHGKIEPMLMASGVIIAIFGGATLFFKNETFIKWKPSVLYWLFAIGILVTQYFFHKNFIRSLMREQITLPEAIWSKLNLAWVCMFLFLGFLNLYVAYHFSTDIWVNFKLFGITGIMFVFVILQGLFLSKYIPKE